jgi:hypothetical protein
MEQVKWTANKHRQHEATFKGARLTVVKYRGNEFSLSVFIEGQPFRFGFCIGLDAAKDKALKMAQDAIDGNT